MFGLGFGEILVILVIVLLVFGPEKLPDVARTLGRTLAELRRSIDDIKHEITMPPTDSGMPNSGMKASTQLTATPVLQGTCEENKVSNPLEKSECGCPSHASNVSDPSSSDGEAVSAPGAAASVTDRGEKTS